MNDATRFSKLNNILRHISAAQVAELFLSPHCLESALLECTKEEGPAMWIVNRSDVYDKTLEYLQRHDIEGIAKRASEKVKWRKASIKPVTPPMAPDMDSDLPDFLAEELLGHPLCPFKIMTHFLIKGNEDQRLSAALSMTRRLLEHPEENTPSKEIEETKNAAYQACWEDPSPSVRSYAAKIPIWKELEISKFIEKENNPSVLKSLVQNPAFQGEIQASLLQAAQEDEYLNCVLILDTRINKTQLSTQRELECAFFESIVGN